MRFYAHSNNGDVCSRTSTLRFFPSKLSHTQTHTNTRNNRRKKSITKHRSNGLYQFQSNEKRTTKKQNKPNQRRERVRGREKSSPRRKQRNKVKIVRNFITPGIIIIIIINVITSIIIIHSHTYTIEKRYDLN